MPSSLAVIHSSTLGSSPHPPVSVYGTGRLALDASVDFLAGMVTCAVRSPEGSRYCRLSARAYGLQRPIPSGRGSVTSRSRGRLQGGRRNLDRLVIGSPLRVPLSPRLTLIRLASFRKPWVFGVNVSTLIVVTYAYIFVSSRSSMAHTTPSRLTGMLPYRSDPMVRSHSFGNGLDARSSSTQLRSTSELLRTL